MQNTSSSAVKSTPTAEKVVQEPLVTHVQSGDVLKNVVESETAEEVIIPLVNHV